MSEKFRANLMMFPSLVNCTTIDYYSEWPQDALLSVAKEQLADKPDSKEGNLDLGEHQEGVESMFSILHKTVEDVSALMIEEVKR
jgi:dynein heavy chain